MTVFFYRELQANQRRYHKSRSAPQNTHIIQEEAWSKSNFYIYIIIYIS